MAQSGGGISGTGVALATAGGFLLYIGIRNVPFLDGLRSFLKGKVPQARAKTPAVIPPELQFPGDTGAAPASGGGLGLQIAQSAQKYLGIPYRWGGADPQGGFDCSGLVTWVLHHDLGIELPSDDHTVTGQFLLWGGAQTIPGPPNAGDLVCWTGHIGIAIDGKRMIHAPDVGQNVTVSNIWLFPPPVFRRVKGTG